MVIGRLGPFELVYPGDMRLIADTILLSTSDTKTDDEAEGSA